MQLKYSAFLILLLIPLAIYCKPKRSNTLKAGDFAPNFTLLDENENQRSLKEFKGNKVVLYFYPKDNTPDCTKEACQLRDAFADYKKNKITILGISYDSPKSHMKFKHKNRLPFSLLSDKNGDVAKMYNANKGLLGSFIPNRKTFLIDESGKIIKIFENVEVKTHSDEILKAFKVK